MNELNINNCIICLEDFQIIIFFNMPISTSDCSCIYIFISNV